MNVPNQAHVNEPVESAPQAANHADRRVERFPLRSRALRVRTGIVAGDRVPKPGYFFDE
jgi:hypothetical protein